MTPKPLPPIALLRERYSYNPETGEITSLQTGAVVGAKATIRGRYSHKYVRMYLGGGARDFINIPAHRLAMALMGHDVNPGVLVDHINCDPLDNRYCNLRLCNNRQNKRNGRKYRTVEIGPLLPKGVTFLFGKFRAMIAVNGKRVHLGMFANVNDAAAAFLRAAAEHHGDFLRAT